MAEAPTNDVRFVYRDLRVPVWDLSTGDNSYVFKQEIQTVDGVLPLVLGLAVYQDGKGKLTGEGTTFLQVGDEVLGASYELSGRVYRSKDAAEAAITVRLSGNGTLAGVNTAFSGKLSYKLTVDETRRLLAGTVTGNVKFNELGGGKVKSDTSSPLDPKTTGAWEILLDTVPFGKLSGSGTITVASALTDGRIMDGTAKGSYNTSKDFSKVKFTGTGPAKGSSLNVNFSTTAGVSTLNEAKGTVLGQKITIN